MKLYSLSEIERFFVSKTLTDLLKVLLGPCRRVALPEESILPSVYITKSRQF